MRLYSIFGTPRGLTTLLHTFPQIIPLPFYVVVIWWVSILVLVQRFTRFTMHRVLFLSLYYTSEDPFPLPYSQCLLGDFLFLPFSCNNFNFTVRHGHTKVIGSVNTRPPSSANVSLFGTDSDGVNYSLFLNRVYRSRWLLRRTNSGSSVPPRPEWRRYQSQRDLYHLSNDTCNSLNRPWPLQVSNITDPYI